jgi:hypothetical protein
MKKIEIMHMYSLYMCPLPTYFHTFPSNKMANFYSIPIPRPDLTSDDIEQLAQITTPDGLVCVYWIRATNQAVFNYGDSWYIQPNANILYAISEIVGVKESVIDVINLYVGNRHDYANTFKLEDLTFTKWFYECTWTDYTCDYNIIQADLTYPVD